MRPYSFLLLFILIGNAPAQSQEFLYDQQSSTKEMFGSETLEYYRVHTNVAVPFIGYGYSVDELYPLGQSFTPSIEKVGFIRLCLWDDARGNGQGSTVGLYLRQDGIQGPILGSASPVFITDAYFDYVTFTFPNPVAVTPETKYYFNLELLSGDSCKATAYDYPYLRGNMFQNGNPHGFDLWFWEGIVIPEPSPVWLFLLGLVLLGINQGRKILRLQKKRERMIT